ncbi:MAG: hypothetical protein E4H20_04985 [Spirochaetales bacterium]|nr:MAG: hypothetical protein E4H20_04985 [Spirochaetales bacterium]
MKRNLSAICILMTMLSIAGAQGLPGLPEQVFEATQQPQLAMPLLTEFFKAEERRNKTGGIVLTATGSLFFAAGAAGAVWAFTADTDQFSDPEELMIYRAVSVGATGTGALLAGLGIGMISRPADRYKTKYAYVYAENDPVVQEAMAYAVMKDLADQARRDRIAGAVVNLSIPLATVGVNAAVAAFSNDWDKFGENLLANVSWTIPNLIGGIMTLVSGKSEEERLLDMYRVTSAGYTGRYPNQ